MNIKDMTCFDKFLTPALIKIVYWVGNIAITFAALRGIFSTFSFMGAGSFQLLVAMILFLVAIIFWRVMCEAIILSFRIYDRLTEIRDRLPDNS